MVQNSLLTGRFPRQERDVRIVSPCEGACKPKAPALLSKQLGAFAQTTRTLSLTSIPSHDFHQGPGLDFSPLR